MTRCRSGEPCGRGQSEVIGVVLVLGLVLAGSVVVVTFGAGALSDSEEALAVQRAEKALTQFDSKASLVALGNTDVQSTELVGGNEGTFRAEPGTGWMNITIKNTTDSSNNFHLVNQSLGSVVYDQPPDVVAYQGGGVWRSTGNGSTMVSPPEFHFRNGTLTLPIVNVTGNPGPAGQAAISHSETIEKFPDSGLADGDNPLDQHRVILVVRSEFYQGWGEYFEERTDGKVSYDHANDEVKLELVTPIGQQTMNSAASSLSASGSFVINGKAKSSCGSEYTNSYDSSQAADCDSQSNGHAGDIIYAGDVNIDSGTGTSNIRGDVKSGGDVHVSSSHGGGQPDVEGNISYTDRCGDLPSHDESVCEDRIILGNGEVEQIAGIESAAAINRFVESRIDSIRDAPDTDDDTDDTTSPPTLDMSGDDTLPAGEYYVEEIDLPSSETLVLDTNGGDVVIAVEERISLGDDSTIEVQGDGIVKVFVRGNHGGTWDLEMAKKSEITNSDQNSSRFRLYGKDEFKAQIGSGAGGNLAQFVGILFAPPGPSGSGEVELHGGEIFGSVLTGTTTITNGGGGSLHYDTALQGRQIISRNASIVKVTYLHVTVNRLRITGG